ncbi:hypothetical protein AMAG_20527 [Allomyces macrogynus ATCC 38327]|uniref:Uncharacterized protein n=1 Tax=Allomyces macrogynus (strain ATCC 38327) TaxID=578462 RepID=A0A0L0TCM3_ALLM3|nr:hypothetical protein AMAG_20527 [Allomyces macrogynus ATCC 38327]|eukprot:KNE72477.1 hypothetical protein AMAG_20527 [Allomyces macrogynus ATCC 38327]
MHGTRPAPNTLAPSPPPPTIPHARSVAGNNNGLLRLAEFGGDIPHSMSCPDLGRRARGKGVTAAAAAVAGAPSAQSLYQSDASKAKRRTSHAVEAVVEAARAVAETSRRPSSAAGVGLGLGRGNAGVLVSAAAVETQGGGEVDGSEVESEYEDGVEGGSDVEEEEEEDVYVSGFFDAAAVARGRAGGAAGYAGVDASGGGSDAGGVRSAPSWGRHDEGDAGVPYHHGGGEGAGG